MEVYGELFNIAKWDTHLGWPKPNCWLSNLNPDPKNGTGEQLDSVLYRYFYVCTFYVK